MLAMKSAGLAVALLVLSSFASGIASAQSTPAPGSGAVTPTPSPAPPAAPLTTPRPAPKLGPVLVGGKHTFVVTFGDHDTQTIYASQSGAPAGAYFVATPATLCIGAITVSSGTSVLFNAPITSGGPFNITRVGNTTGCAVSISSSAGGQPATVVFP